MRSVASRLRAFAGSRWAALAKVAVSLGILLWFALRLDYAALGRLLADIRPSFLLALAVLNLARVGIAVVRFRLLTDLLQPVPLTELGKQYLVAAYFNSFLPTALGGDAVRVFMLAACGVAKQQGAVLIVIERLMGFSALVLLAVVGVLTFPVPRGVELAVFLLASGFAVAVAAFLLGRPAFDGLARRFPVLDRAWRALALLSASHRALAGVFVLSIVFQVATISLSFMVAAALGIEVSFTACLALVPLVWILTMAPVSLGGIGVREAAFAFLFGLVGVSTEASLLISLGTFAALLSIAAIGAGVFFSDSVVRRLTGLAKTEPMPHPTPGGSRSPHLPLLVLAALTVLVSAAHLLWIHLDDDFLPTGDSYAYLANLLRFVDGLGSETLRSPWQALGDLGFGGRPPLYQLLTVPFLVFGRSVDAALGVNLAFLVVLMFFTYRTGRLMASPAAGLLAAFLVACYPPIVHLVRTYLPYSALPACVAASLYFLISLAKTRSRRTVWWLALSFAFGFLIHPQFIRAVALPALAVGLWTVFCQQPPRRPPSLRQLPRWAWGKLSDPLVTRALAPATAVALVLALPWYLTWGRRLFRLFQNFRAGNIAEFRGFDVKVIGFHQIEPSFWWYLETARGTLSWVFAAFAVVGLVYGLGAGFLRRRGPILILALTLAATYAVLSLSTTLAWWTFSMVLPAVALLTALWIVEVRNRWLSTALILLCVVVGLVNFSVVTLGLKPSLKPWVQALGAPFDLRGVCQTREHLALCPAPPRSEQAKWPAAEILAAVVEDSRSCREKLYRCSFLAIETLEIKWVRFSFYLARDWPDVPLRIASIGSPAWGHPYNFDSLLKSEYVLHPDGWLSRRRNPYINASARFLGRPPEPFADSHETVGTFELPNRRRVRLIKRTERLTLEEARASVDRLDVAPRYKTRGEKLVASMERAEKRRAQIEARKAENRRPPP